MQNITAFNEDDKEKIPEVYDQLKEELSRLAIIICESNEHISEAEFAVLMMKFSHNERIKKHLKYIESRISQLLEFNPLLRAKNDPETCPYVEYLLKFDNPR